MLNQWENKSMAGKITIKNATKVALHGLKPGQTMEIAVDGAGVPLDRLWRRRLADAAHDRCIEVVTETKPSKKAKE